MTYRGTLLPFVLLIAGASQTEEQPLLFPTRDVIVEVKNEEQGRVRRPQELLFFAKEKKVRINEIGHKYYSIMDYAQNIMMTIDQGPPPTYAIDKLPDSVNIKYLRTGAVKEIAGQKCAGWQRGEITVNHLVLGTVTYRTTFALQMME